jgi:hypothetical protein
MFDRGGASGGTTMQERFQKILGVVCIPTTGEIGHLTPSAIDQSTCVISTALHPLQFSRFS